MDDRHPRALTGVIGQTRIGMREGGKKQEPAGAAGLQPHGENLAAPIAVAEFAKDQSTQQK